MRGQSLPPRRSRAHNGGRLGGSWLEWMQAGLGSKSGSFGFPWSPLSCPLSGHSLLGQRRGTVKEILHSQDKSMGTHNASSVSWLWVGENPRFDVGSGIRTDQRGVSKAFRFHAPTDSSLSAKRGPLRAHPGRIVAAVAAPRVQMRGATTTRISDTRRRKRRSPPHEVGRARPRSGAGR